MLVEGNESLARKVGADGVHSPPSALLRLVSRPAVRLWAVSCHNAEELARAAALGADFVALSPVLPTPTHPDRPGMGWEGFAAHVRDYPLPVYALGGRGARRHPHRAVRHRQRARAGLDTHGLKPVSEYFVPVRFGGSLVFASVAYFEDIPLEARARFPKAKTILIVGSGINRIDASGEEKIRELAQALRESGVTLAFSGLKKPIRDAFEAGGWPRWSAARTCSTPRSRRCGPCSLARGGGMSVLLVVRGPEDLAHACREASELPAWCARHRTLAEARAASRCSGRGSKRTRRGSLPPC